MSFWDYLFDSQFRQRSDINRLRQQSDRAARLISRKSGKLEERVAELEQQIASLSLFSRTLLRILSDKKICTLKEWEETFRALDLEDGQIDGR